MASAALEDAPVRADDLRLAVKLAIVPRSKFALDMPKEDMMPPPPPPPSKAPQPQDNMNDKNEDKEDDSDKDEDKEEDKDEEQEDLGEPSIPEEFMFSAEGVPLEDDLTKVICIVIWL
jgi:magnesium chelatase subunit D